MFVFAFTMVRAGLSDLTTMKIRNGLMLLFLIAFVLLAPFAGFTAAEIGWSAVAAAGVLGCTFTFFALGWMGGGDAKLATLTVLWLGADHTATYLVYAAFLGGVLTVGLILLRTSILTAWLGTSPWMTQLLSPASGIPYGIALAVSGLLVFPQTRWMTVLF